MKKVIFLLVAMVMVSFPQSSFGEDTKYQLELCSKIENNIKRLQCYDDLVGKNQSTAHSSIGHWSVRTENSKFTDTKTIYIHTNALEEIHDRYNNQVTPYLFFRCEDNKTEAFIGWEMFIGTGSTNVTYRIDKEKVKNVTWNTSTDNKAVFISKPINFIKSLMDKQNLIVEIIPYGENRRMVEFNVTGLREAIQPLQEACNWK